jgi:hypothetical protein
MLYFIKNYPAQARFYSIQRYVIEPGSAPERIPKGLSKMDNTEKMST